MDGRLYIIALGSLERLEMQFVPLKLSLNRSADIEELKVVGRNNPIHHYTSGSDRLNFELDFYSIAENRDDVITKVNWLQSLAYNDGYALPPERVKVVFGDVFRDEVWVVKSVQADLSLFNKNHAYLPQQAYVKLQLMLDPDRNLRLNDIKR